MSTAITTLAGKLFKEPDYNFTTGGTALVKFTLPSETILPPKDGEKQKETIWIECKLWGERAEKLAPYLHKGTIVLVQGEMKARLYYSEKYREHKIAYELNIRDLQIVQFASMDDATSPQDQFLVVSTPEHPF